mgnify:FL=1
MREKIRTILLACAIMCAPAVLAGCPDFSSGSFLPERGPRALNIYGDIAPDFDTRLQAGLEQEAKNEGFTGYSDENLTNIRRVGILSRVFPTLGYSYDATINQAMHDDKVIQLVQNDARSTIDILRTAIKAMDETNLQSMVDNGWLHKDTLALLAATKRRAAM